MTTRRPVILIIDNDEGMTTALAARLEHAGYCCDTASCGAQGLARFKAGDVDLVITDLNMPAGDGVALCHTLRRTSDVPIIIITGFQAEYRRELRGIRHTTVVRKPFDSAQLLELIEADLIMSGRDPGRLAA